MANQLIHSFSEAKGLIDYNMTNNYMFRYILQKNEKVLRGADLCPAAIVNDRLWGQGDYITLEEYIPLRAWDDPWELGTTLNESWGYYPPDQNGIPCS